MSDECCRTIVRHIGPPGPGLPPGGLTGQIATKASNADFDVVWSSSGAGLGDVVGPASSTNNRIAAFNGTTGKLIKDSGLLVSEVFTVTAATSKVDKVTGKVLSSNDFTDALKAKLDAATAENFRGSYATLLDLTTAIPAGNPGDYAFVVTVGTSLVEYVWDTVNNVWASINASVIFTGQDIADVLFNPTDSAAYSQANTRIYTTAEKDKVAAAATTDYVNSLALAAGVLTPSYGATNYFNTTGTAIPITAISDGVTNLVSATPATSLDPASALFDSPSPGRLRYTGTSSRLFVATFNVSFSGPVSSDIVVTLSKNGSALPVSKMIQGVDSAGTTAAVSATDFVSLTTNDYIEVQFGNLTNTNDPTLKKLGIVISPA